MATRIRDDETFRALTDPYRRELQLHCYRILGSVQDAEDVLQETMLAAWRGLDGFEGRASLRAWLYRIATNRCLNALRDGGRRPPSATDLSTLPEPTRLGEPTWLEPYPDALLEGAVDARPGPEARYEAREAVALAFVAGLQRLPPLQRAVLVLRDALGFRAAEVAEMLDSTEASVTSALQRARGALEAREPAVARTQATLPSSARARKIAGTFADAFERGDIDGVVALLTDDVWLTMPPEPLEYQGRAAVGAFLSERTWAGGRRVRVIPTGANGQTAFGYYLTPRGERGAAAHASPQTIPVSGLLVLTLREDGIAALTRFRGDVLDRRFGLPARLDV